MRKKIISRVNAYLDTECINCKFFECTFKNCNTCKNHLLKDKYGHSCACLQIKRKKEKSCPFFEEE